MKIKRFEDIVGMAVSPGAISHGIWPDKEGQICSRFRLEGTNSECSRFIHAQYCGRIRFRNKLGVAWFPCSSVGIHMVCVPTLEHGNEKKRPTVNREPRTSEPLNPEPLNPEPLNL